MIENTSKSDTAILEQIARKRVGRTLEALDLAGCGEEVKFAVKKQIWAFKNEVESKVLGKEDNYAIMESNNQ